MIIRWPAIVAICAVWITHGATLLGVVGVVLASGLVWIATDFD